jgi:hypothetical protein
MPRATHASGRTRKGFQSKRTFYGIRTESPAYNLRHAKEINEKIQEQKARGLVVPYKEWKELKRRELKKKIKERGYQELCEKCWKGCKVFGGENSAFSCNGFELKYSLRKEL